MAALVDCLRLFATGHAGTAPSAMKLAMVRAVLARSDPKTLVQLASDLSRSTDPGAQEVGSQLLAATYPRSGARGIELLHALSQSPNWEVREWTGAAFGSMLTNHFETLWPVVNKWVTDGSDAVRRAAVIALMECGKQADEDRGGKLLDLLGSLLRDPSPYVQANLGPFAIGSVLAARFPQAVTQRLRVWLTDDNESARRQLALVFSARAGAALASPARDVLAVLAEDARPSVRRAFRKAMHAIQRHAPVVTFKGKGAPP